VNDFSSVKEVRVPKSIAEETQSFLRAVGRTQREGMVLWVGDALGDRFDVTHLLIPKQHGVRSDNGVCVVVDGDEMHRINVELFKSKLKLIAQIHSHPTDAYHSETDDQFAIATTVGCLSLVVPDFAEGDFRLTDCAVYRLQRNGEWKHLPPNRAAELIQIQDF
jgi:hypothetical protein